MLIGANTDDIVFGKNEDSYGRDARTTVLILKKRVSYALLR